MRGAYVSPKRTPVAPEDMRAALAVQFASRGIAVSEHVLTTLVAMSAHETGRWASCWNNNLGNVKAGPTWDGSYTCLTNVWEILNGVKRWFSPQGETAGKNGPVIGAVYEVPPGHPQTRFRAYATLAEGVVGFVDKMLGMYRASLDVLLGGGATDAFLASLKRQRYFTGDLEAYQKSVRSYYAEFNIAWYQRVLAELGYDPGPADGVAGPRARAAVLAFQRAAGLVPDGVVGPQTVARLAEKLAAKRVSDARRQV